VNRKAVLRVLREALATDGDANSEVSQQFHHLPPDVARRARVLHLAPSVAEILAKQPEYATRPNLGLRSGGGATGFPPFMAAHHLINVALDEGPGAAVDGLATVLRLSTAVGMWVMPLWRLNVGRKIELAPDLFLMPFSDLSESFGQRFVTSPSERRLGAWLLPGAILNYEPPSAVLAQRVVLDPLFIDIENYSAEPLSDSLDDVRRCLSVLAARPFVGPVHWFQYEDPHIHAFAAESISGNPLEIIPNALPTAVSINVGDKAADLSIALETLLTSDSGEHRWKVSTRAGILSGGDIDAKAYRRSIIAAVYDMRSGLVHTGSAAPKYPVRGRGKMLAPDILQEGVSITAMVIQKIIERGSVPRWDEFDISGGRRG
jgi:hypothetical protein